MASLLTEMLADSPTMLLRLNEPSGTAANDSSSGGTHDGTLQANVAFGSTAIVASDTSADFTATAPSYIDVADHADFDRGNGAFSVAFVLARDTVSVNQIVMTKGTTATSWSVWIGTGNYINLANATEAATPVYAPIGSDTNRHLYVITYNGASTGLIYKDGTNITESTGTEVTFANTADALRIGDSHAGSRRVDGKMAYVAYFPSALSSTRVTAYWAAIDGVDTPTWTTPADTVSMSTTPDLKFTSPSSAVKQHFQLQLDTVNTFNSGNLRTYDSSTVQTNWTYYNGASWVAIPSDGLPIAYAGNEVDYTVTSALSGATWYRRVRAGTLA